MQHLLYAGEKLIFFCEPVWDVSDNADIILQIVYKMFDIKDIFKFPVEKANVPNNVGNMSESKTQHM